ncbi:MAG: hypothetical protein N3F05_02925 [Candidatus Diapherotrites archaeon]|nr:hypothetical protein [Candidatus Diapherotrites archaeon]
MGVNSFVKSKLFGVSSNLSVYGFLHFAVDAACAGIIFSGFGSFGNNLPYFAYLILLYNVLAFGLQLPFGWIADITKKPKEIALLGILLTAIAIFIPSSQTATAVFFAGIGNALFHIGGGVISLNLIPKKASAPGLFVAPGAVGLLLGTLAGKGGFFNQFIFACMLIVPAVLILFLAQPKINNPEKFPEKQRPDKSNFLVLGLSLLLITIAARSFIGFAMNFPWKGNQALLWALVFCIALGKAIGGVLGDKFGWIRLGVAGLVVSAPLLYIGWDFALAGLIGALLFNMTMPITLVAIANLLEKRPGLSFGLACTALLAGALPFFSEFGNYFGNKEAVFFSVLVSAMVLLLALKLYERIIKPDEY